MNEIFQKYIPAIETAKQYFMEVIAPELIKLEIDLENWKVGFGIDKKSHNVTFALVPHNSAYPILIFFDGLYYEEENGQFNMKIIGHKCALRKLVCKDNQIYTSPECLIFKDIVSTIILVGIYDEIIGSDLMDVNKPFAVEKFNELLEEGQQLDNNETNGE